MGSRMACPGVCQFTDRGIVRKGWDSFPNARPSPLSANTDVAGTRTGGRVGSRMACPGVCGVWCRAPARSFSQGARGAFLFFPVFLSCLCPPVSRVALVWFRPSYPRSSAWSAIHPRSRLSQTSSHGLSWGFAGVLGGLGFGVEWLCPTCSPNASSVNSAGDRMKKGGARQVPVVVASSAPTFAGESPEKEKSPGRSLDSHVVRCIGTAGVVRGGRANR